MEIVLVVCVATLGVCAVLARPGPRTGADRRALRDTAPDPLDQALFHLINEVARRPTPRLGTVSPDRVMVDSRLRALGERVTWN